MVLPEDASGLEFDYRAGVLPQMATDEIVVIDVSEKAYPLAVTTVGVRQVLLHSDFSHTALGKVAQREDEFFQLGVGDACQKVGLVLNGVGRGGQVFEAVITII